MNTRRVTLCICASILCATPGYVLAQHPGVPARDSLRATPASPTRSLDSAFVIDSVPSAGIPAVVPANPIEPLAGSVPAVRVRYPSAEPGALPVMDLRYRAGLPASAAPLFVFDGVPLAAPPFDLPPGEIATLEVISGLGGAARHGTDAAGGVIYLRSRAPSALDPGVTAVRARAGLGSAWTPGESRVSRHHHFLLGPDGGYVDADGNPVPASQRVPDPDGIADNPYPGPVYDHREALFEPGALMYADAAVHRGHAGGMLTLSAGHAREQASVRDGDTYARTHVRFGISHRLDDVVSLELGALHARSDLPAIPEPDDYLQAATLLRPDVDVLEPSLEYAYVPWLRSDILLLNPLSDANRRMDAARARSLVGVRARGGFREWLELEAGFGWDRLEQEMDRLLPLIRSNPDRLDGFGTAAADRTRSRRTIEGRATARTRWLGADLAGTLTAARWRASDDGTVAQEIEGAGTTRSWFVRERGTIITLGADAVHESGLELAARVRRETLPFLPVVDRTVVDHLVSIAFDAARSPWLDSPLLDRAAIRLTSASAAHGVPVDPSDPDAWLLPVADDAGPAREHEVEAALELSFGGRFDATLAYARARVADALFFPPTTTMWQNMGTVTREVVEATVGARLMEHDGFSWTADLVLDRGRQHITEFGGPPMLVSDTRWYEGATVGEIWGYRFVQSLDDLDPVHAGSGNAFALNDDGLVVPVGAGGSLGDRSWGSTVTIDGRDYPWGLPIQRGALEELGDRTPDLGLGLGSTLRWQALMTSVRFSGQIGGDRYDYVRHVAYAIGTHADVDQSARPDALRKPTSYYEALSAGVVPTAWFIEDATHLRLRELSISFAPVAFRGVSVTVVGRNLFTLPDADGDLEAPLPTARGLLDSAAGAFGLPHPRSLSLQVGYGW